jgi:putative ABC transport system substrate-binding protein
MVATIARRDFAAVLASAALAWPLAARAQQPKMPVIAYVSSQSPEPEDRRSAFRQGLKDNGYVEGENVATEYRFAGYEMDRLPELLAEFDRRRVSVIVATSGPITALAAKMIKTIPIVFMVPEDPVKLGLVTSLARPGGNVTGVNFFLTELVGKRLGLLHELVPAAVRVAALVNPAEATIAETTLRELEPAARTIGVQTKILKATTSNEINAAFAEIARERPDALFVASSPFFGARSVQLANLASRHAIPAVYANRRIPETGGLMSYGTDAVERYRQAGLYTGRILKGAKPTDLPVAQSTKFELVINAETARLLNLTIPPGLRAIADEIIE